MRIQRVAGTSRGGKPERETMRNHKKRIKYAKRMRRAALLSAVLMALSGCTRKEELLLLEEEPALAQETADVVLKDAGEPDDSMENGQMPEEQPAESEAVPEETRFIYVHVCGAVARPGVYELKAGSRVYEAVQAAGGFAEHAEQNYVNQAQTLDDGVKLVIPTVEEAAAAREGEPLTAASEAGGGGTQLGIVAGEPSGAAGGGTQDESGDGRININTASEEQLCGIPGVGAARAAAIAAYRDANGGFKKPEDIMKVSGIKEGMYEKIKDSICVN